MDLVALAHKRKPAYIWYKKKVAGPFFWDGFEAKESDIIAWKEIVNSGAVDFFEDTPPMNDDMKNHPNDVHILEKSG